MIVIPNSFRTLQVELRLVNFGRVKNMLICSEIQSITVQVNFH